MCPRNANEYDCNICMRKFYLLLNFKNHNNKQYYVKNKIVDLVFWEGVIILNCHRHEVSIGQMSWINQQLANHKTLEIFKKLYTMSFSIKTYLIIKQKKQQTFMLLYILLYGNMQENILQPICLYSAPKRNFS